MINSTNLSHATSSSINLVSKESLILNQLQSAQQEVNHLRLINVCLQSTLFRVQTQLIDYLPANIPDEIKRNETQQQLALLRQSDDHSRRIISPQQLSFFENFKNLFDQKQKQLTQPISLSKNEKQIEILYEMFHELNTMIHTEHHERIAQLYITLAQTSHSVIKAREVLDHTIDAHQTISRRKFQRKIFVIFIAGTFISILVFVILLSIRIR